MAENEVHVRVTAEDKTKPAFDSAKRNADGFGESLKRVGQIAGGILAANVVGSGLSKMSSFFGDSIAATKESIAVNAQLDAVLKSTGGAAGVTAEEVRKLAGTLERNSMFSDEAIISGQNMLLTFTNIGKNAFPAATAAMVDLSQAMGQDMKTSAIQLGKALNDPVEGITALRRVGVAFSDEQENLIKLHMDHGNVMQAQKIILAELNKEFGGSAKAVSDAAGASEVYKDKMEALKEQIGEKLLPLQVRWKELQVEIISYIAETVIPTLETLSAFIGATLSGDTEKANAALAQMSPTMQDVAKAMGDVAVFIQESLIPAIQDTVAFIKAHWPEISAVIAFGVDEAKTKIEGFIGAVSAVVALVEDVADGVSDLVHGRWREAWENFRRIPTDILNILTNMVKLTFGNLPKLIAGFATEAASAATKWGRAVFDGVWDTIKGLPEAMARLGADAAQRFISSISVAGISVGDVAGTASKLTGGVINPFTKKKAAGGPASGLTWVGEQGPELVNLPSGSNVYSNSTSMRMAGGSGGTMTINLYIQGSVLSERDLLQKVRDAISGGAFRGAF